MQAFKLLDDAYIFIWNVEEMAFFVAMPSRASFGLSHRWFYLHLCVTRSFSLICFVNILTAGLQTFNIYV